VKDEYGEAAVARPQGLLRFSRDWSFILNSKKAMVGGGGGGR
jgi:hypothetical protein